MRPMQEVGAWQFIKTKINSSRQGNLSTIDSRVESLRQGLSAKAMQNLLNQPEPTVGSDPGEAYFSKLEH